ncbi:MAG: hypothetical protein AAB906_02655, partial [Patescibacteria group bacterium]
LFLLLNLRPMPIQAASSMCDTAKDGGIETIGSEAFGITSGQEKDPRILAAGFIKVFLGVLGLVFLILIISAGFNYMTAQGSTEKIEKAIGQIKAAAIGLIIILAAYSIAGFVIDQIFNVINRYD